MEEPIVATRYDGLLFDFLPAFFVALVFFLLLAYRLRPSPALRWSVCAAALGIGLATVAVYARFYLTEDLEALSRGDFSQDHRYDPTAPEPWYLLGRGDQLMYWDPWWKGVALPLLFLLGPGLAAVLFTATSEKIAQAPRRGMTPVVLDAIIVATGLMTLGAVLLLILGPSFEPMFGLEMYSPSE